MPITHYGRPAGARRGRAYDAVMPESTKVEKLLADVVRRLDVIESKLDVVARALGGPHLKSLWDALEAKAGRPAGRRTFRRRRCGCFVGGHEPGCEAEARARAGAGAGGGEER